MGTRFLYTSANRGFFAASLRAVALVFEHQRPKRTALPIPAGRTIHEFCSRIFAGIGFGYSRSTHDRNLVGVGACIVAPILYPSTGWAAFGSQNGAYSGKALTRSGSGRKARSSASNNWNVAERISFDFNLDCNDRGRLCRIVSRRRPLTSQLVTRFGDNSKVSVRAQRCRTYSPQPTATILRSSLSSRG